MQLLIESRHLARIQRIASLWEILRLSVGKKNSSLPLETKGMQRALWTSLEISHSPDGIMKYSLYFFIASVYLDQWLSLHAYQHSSAHSHYKHLQKHA